VSVYVVAPSASSDCVCLCLSLPLQPAVTVFVVARRTGGGGWSVAAVVARLWREHGDQQGVSCCALSVTVNVAVSHNLSNSATCTISSTFVCYTRYGLA
jgi:hypothetical protein